MSSDKNELQLNINIYEKKLKELIRNRDNIANLIIELHKHSNVLTPIITNTRNDTRHSEHIDKKIIELQEYNRNIQQTEGRIASLRSKLKGGGVRNVNVAVKQVKTKPTKSIVRKRT